MKTRKKFPNYDIESPKYPALTVLYDNLAYQDATFQANQTILEFFNEHISVNNIDGKKFLRELAIKYRISAGTEDIKRISEMMAESYIIQTYNIAELFFKEFIKTFKFVYNVSSWKDSKKVGTSDKKLDPLNQIYENLTAQNKRKLKSLPEFLLADYYRQLRNGYVHREIEKTESMKKPGKFFKDHIDEVIPHFKHYYKTLPKDGVPAPNKPENISHRDFVLYSRALRNLGNFLNELCSFTVEQAFQLAENDPKFFNTPRKINIEVFPYAKDKLDIYLRNYYKTHFGTSESQIEQFISAYYSKYKTANK